MHFLRLIFKVHSSLFYTASGPRLIHPLFHIMDTEEIKQQIQIPLTSTPEKSDENNKPDFNISGISGTSSHFSDKIKRLTPIENLNNLHYHDQEYLSSVIKKASQGSTFFPESRNLKIPNTKESADADIDDDLTPLFKKAPNNKPKIGLNINLNESTPLLDKTNKNIGIGPNQQEKILSLSKNTNDKSKDNNKNTRNIFNLTPELRFNNTNNNPVKNAFNLFDRSSLSFASGNSSINSRSFKRTRKRLRSSGNESMNISETQYNNSKTKQQSTRQISKTNYEYLHSILSDPQCISNITILVQIILNILMILGFLGFAVFTILTIKHDVHRKISGYTNNLINEINSCKRDYLINNCSPDIRVPALEVKCNEWDTCMNQNPELIITSIAYFEILSDCVNAFFKNISIKSLFGIGLIFMFSIILPNILFSKVISTSIDKNHYYSNNNDYSECPRSIPSSPLRITENVNSSLNHTNQLENNHANVSSVRFNPNVSYSFYNDDDDDADLEDENFIGNQRILLE